MHDKTTLGKLLWTGFSRLGLMALYGLKAVAKREKIWNAYASVLISLMFLIAIPGLNANPNVGDERKFIFTTLYCGMVVGMWFQLILTYSSDIVNHLIDKGNNHA